MAKTTMNTACGILLLALSSALHAASPPGLIDYQGVLRGSMEEPLSGTYDMTFRFFDAESGGDEILVDAHLAGNMQSVSVDGGLFSVGLGGGAVVDGAGPGSYASLSAMFHDFDEVWLEVQIQAEVLSPRTRVLAGAYALNATSAETADQLDGRTSDFFLDTSATRQTKGGTIQFHGADPTHATVEAIGDAGASGALSASNSSGTICRLAWGNSGIDCSGSHHGGYFYDTTDGSFAYAAYATYGIYASSPSYGGFFTSTGGAGTGIYGTGPVYGGRFLNTVNSSEVFLAGPDPYGLQVHGPWAARFLQDGLPGTYTDIGYSGYGIWSKNYNGIHSVDIVDSSYARIGKSPYKIQGTGTVSFVQNHPDDPKQVVIYHAPESSEVNVFTRGSARLVNGTARVALDPTFAWTANPDIGLTAHLTPRGEPIALAVEDVSTRELLVRGPRGSSVAFDYWVTGLRIGFEEIPPVSPKELESAIPSRASGADIYAKEPSLRVFNALERYRVMAGAVGLAVDPDLNATAELRDRIGIGKPPDPDAPAFVSAAFAQARPAAAGVENSTDASRVDPRTAEVFMATSAVEAGDVVVLDPAIPGAVRRCESAADPRLVGVALDRDHEGKIAVAFAAVHDVLVDATDAPIAIGDLLSTSATAGAAMHATIAAPGTILGKALDPLASGVGTIRVLLMPR